MIQLQVLNVILDSKDSSIITLNNLNSDYFSEYKDEFCFINSHILKYGNVPDMETFINQFPNFEVVKVSEPLNYLLEELMRDKNKRFLAANFNQIRSLIMNDKVEDAMQLLKQASEQSSAAVSLQCVDILRDKSRYDAYIERLENYDKYFIKTGFDELDKIIGGWDVKEELATIVARMGLGKSWLLFKCASAAAKQGKRVGIYSGEMSENKVGYRLDTLIGHISNGALVHGSASIKNEYKRYLDNLDKNVPGSIYVLTPNMINGPATPSALRAFIEKYEIEILFIDQHSLLEDDHKAKNPVEAAGNIAKDLKLLQTIKQIPIISVCQQNREKVENSSSGGKSFDTSQVAQSDKIGQYSTIIIFIERDGDLFKLHLVKSRDTENGAVLTYRTNLNDGQFDYIPSEKDNNSENENTSSLYDGGYTGDEVF